MDYLILAAAVSSGVGGTLFVRASEGLRRRLPLLGALICYTAATIGLSQLVDKLPVGLVYAVWAGCAALALLVIDRLVYKEALGWRQFLGVAIVVCGVVLLSTEMR